jgi:hypothetical protein
MLLVGAVVLLAAASLSLNLADVQKMLVGAVISLSSAAVAYYFSSTAASEARRDLLSATSTKTTTPDLVNKTIEEAQKSIEGTGFSLKVPNNANATGIIDSQSPMPGTPVDRWQVIEVTKLK